MQDWYDEYKGDNGTALTDTLSTDLFLLDFDRSMANNFTGVRHDSGDPYEWGEKIIAHYQKYGISVALLSFQHLVLPVFLILAILVNCSDILLEF